MKVSVIMSVFNGERFVCEAIESLLAQTYQEFELLVVDDASTDATPKILEELAAQDRRIRVLTNTTNLGLTKSLNIALRLPLDGFDRLTVVSSSNHKLGVAQDNFVARMDADDIALPNRLEKQIAFLDTHPNIDVVGTDYEWIDEYGEVIGRPRVITDPDEIHRVLPRTNPLLHSSVLMRRAALERVQGYDETYARAQDYDLWLRLAHRATPEGLSRTCRFANLQDVLMQKRLAKGMVSFASEREQLRCAVRARLNALRRGDFPIWNAIFILKPLIASLLPARIVRCARVHVFGQRHYDHPTLQ